MAFAENVVPLPNGKKKASLGHVWRDGARLLWLNLLKIHAHRQGADSCRGKLKKSDGNV